MGGNMNNRKFDLFALLCFVYVIVSFFNSWIFFPLELNPLSQYAHLSGWQKPIFFDCWFGFFIDLIIVLASLVFYILKRYFLFVLIIFLLTIYGFWSSFLVVLTIYENFLNWFFVLNQVYAVLNIALLIASIFLLIQVCQHKKF